MIGGVIDYPGNARAIRLLGALPVLVDCLPGRWTLDPDRVLAAATPRTAAVIVSHLYGEIAEITAIRELCDRRGWWLIEDVCQMPGAEVAGRPLGTFGHIAAWSFGGSKPLTAGCGGAATTTDDRLAQRLAAHCDRPSDAFPLSPLQAAVLIPQWRRLAAWGARQHERLERLVANVAAATPGWTWPTVAPAAVRRVHYKVPVQFSSESLEPLTERMVRMLDLADSFGIPAGEPFRLPGKLAPSRGRVESVEEARRMTQRTWLLDHRVLEGTDRDLERLTHWLIRLHDATFERSPKGSER